MIAPVGVAIDVAPKIKREEAQKLWSELKMGGVHFRDAIIGFGDHGIAAKARLLRYLHENGIRADRDVSLGTSRLSVRDRPTKALDAAKAFSISASARNHRRLEKCGLDPGFEPRRFRDYFILAGHIGRFVFESIGEWWQNRAQHS